MPASKSYTHRAYFTALLAEGGTVRHPLQSEDTDATLACLENFTASVDRDGTNDAVVVEPEAPVAVESDEIFVKESGTLLRFLIPIVTVLEGPREVTLVGEDSLLTRSNTEPITSLREAGFEVRASGEDDTVPITCFPGQHPGEGAVGVACSTTSQYLSGWLLAMTGIGGGSLKRTTELVSAPYVAMTEDVLEAAGIGITHPEPDRYELSTGSTGPMDYEVPGDYSSAAFFLVGGCLHGGSLTLRGLREEDRQADRRILSILGDLGLEVNWEGSAGERQLRVSKAGSIGEFTVDASDCPDLVPILSVLGVFGEGESRIENVGHLTNKESDRLNRTAEELRKIGVEVKTGSDRLSLKGSVDVPRSVELNAHGDHRLAMAFSILATKVGKIVVDGVECVSKSYPEFFEDLEALGGEFELVK